MAQRPTVQGRPKRSDRELDENPRSYQTVCRQPTRGSNARPKVISTIIMESSNQSQPWESTEIIEKNDMMAITILEVMLGLIFLVGGTLNCVLVAVFIRRRGFRLHLSNRFLMNLVLANLLACFVLIPMVLVDVIDEGPTLFCSALRGITTLTSTGSILAQLLIGIDQHLAVLHPLHYHRLINEAKCKLSCIMTWLISIAMAALAGLDPDDGSGFSGFFQSCKGQTPSGYPHLMTMVTISASFLLPALIMAIMYMRIFLAARENSIRTRRNSACSMTFEGVNVKNGPNNNKYLSVSNSNISRNPSTRSANLAALTSNLRASMRSKLSHASNLLLYGEESRAAKVTIFVMLSICFCWLPYYGVVLLDIFYWKMPQWAFCLGMICALSNTMFSPVLYAYRSVRIRRDVRKVFGLSMRGKRTKLTKGNLEKAKINRMKSLSCPQLLISSVNDNEVTSKSLLSQFSYSKASEERPIRNENSLALPTALLRGQLLPHSHSDVVL